MLYIIPTPIGNLEDISFRAIDVLKSVDLIACEDTRQTMKLLDRYKINKTLVSYHQHSKVAKIDYLIDQLKNNKNIALVSDAGTPGISDPGHMLVDQAHKNNIGTGYNLTNFTYLGYMPHKKGRQTLLKKIKQENTVFVFYESTHRIIKLLNELVEYIPNRDICVAKELSKIHEEFIHGTPKQVLETLEKDPKKQKGEFVVVINKD